MKLVRASVGVAYPFLIFGGMQWLEPRWLAVLLGSAALLQAMIGVRRPAAADIRRLSVPALLVGPVIVLSCVLNDVRYLLFVPALVNGALLVAFGRTLRSGPPLVETFARLRHPNLPEVQVPYCRSVTRVWCAFFALNGSCALWLALAGDPWLWALYTGLISYLLMGLLFGVEFLVRSWRFGSYRGTRIEPVFRRLFRQGPAL